MKIQNNKKITTTIVTALVVGLITSSTAFPYVTAQLNPTTSSLGSSCDQMIKREIHDKAISIDAEKAKSMALDNAEFKLKTAGYNHKFNSIFNTWSMDKSKCSVTLNTVNVVHSFNYTKDLVKNVVVTMDPSLTKVANVTEQIVPRASTSTDTYNWAGYEYYALNSLSNKYAVYEATTTFTLPSIGVPSSPTNACKTNLGYQPCDLAIWDGLEDVIGATDDKLAQAGTDEHITYNGGYQYSYYMWYEFLPSSLVQCTGLTVAPGHSITPDVYSEVTYGGSSTSYDILITDHTNSQICTVTGQSYFTTSTPVYAPFIDERLCNTNASPCPVQQMSTLPSFVSDTLSSSTMYYNGGTNSIDTSASHSWFNQAKMDLNGSSPPNISNGAESGGSFTETYRNSLGT